MDPRAAFASQLDGRAPHGSGPRTIPPALRALPGNAGKATDGAPGPAAEKSATEKADKVRDRALANILRRVNSALGELYQAELTAEAIDAVETWMGMQGARGILEEVRRRCILGTL